MDVLTLTILHSADTTIPDMGILMSGISISFYMPAILRHNQYL